MNRRPTVWLPPDGDSRLVRFQAAAAGALGIPGLVSMPPYLELTVPGRVPIGAVFLGGWRWESGTFIMAARDDLGSPGVFRMGLGPGRVWNESDLGKLPLTPGWSWTRGRTAWVTVEDRPGPGAFVLWSWEGLSGWRSDHPKG